ncbi:hypothetical protein [Aliikangiella sp. G2MR2-5]|uniref:hypothetical protein n=1 Tax=Aliikangiella sp. G2MR2-5 TaxID=2788943 RepID=UPI0018AB5B25|nr:hypothetical protein [Aliikangiella sp. G2MR2-5]
MTDPGKSVLIVVEVSEPQLLEVTHQKARDLMENVSPVSKMSEFQPGGCFVVPFDAKANTLEAIACMSEGLRDFILWSRDQSRDNEEERILINVFSPVG